MPNYIRRDPPTTVAMNVSAELAEHLKSLRQDGERAYDDTLRRLLGLQPRTKYDSRREATPRAQVQARD